ncbi:hypothetical protein J7K97_00915 [Candidatus Aerophobetes bacterium]|nr:hypothetical protein [Candidatus Aerophobetes bacterium]
MEKAISEILIQIFILGWLANYFVEMIKKAVNQKNYSLLIAWLVGIIICLLANWRLLSLVGINTTDSLDKILSGAILGNSSRFLHDFGVFLNKKLPERAKFSK